MARYRLIAFSSAVPGREADYKTWYDGTHLGEITSLKGVKSGQRFELAVNMMQSPAFQPNLAIYEIETDDINGVLQEMGQLATSGKMSHTDALDAKTAALGFYVEASPVVKSK